MKLTKKDALDIYALLQSRTSFGLVNNFTSLSERLKEFLLLDDVDDEVHALGDDDLEDEEPCDTEDDIDTNEASVTNFVPATVLHALPPAKTPRYVTIEFEYVQMEVATDESLVYMLGNATRLESKVSHLAVNHTSKHLYVFCDGFSDWKTFQLQDVPEQWKKTFVSNEVYEVIHD